jgi:hypothetical protein
MWDVFLLTGSNVSGETAASIFRIDLFYTEVEDRSFVRYVFIYLFIYFIYLSVTLRDRPNIKTNCQLCVIS